ncbi:uncharacterized protein LOC131244196 [Magnolia sinica]|uniref:uncharacterized protein LOC131244196 n=1 Tax=Magnolia sinica TaxID=86752 RepID=UPI002659AD75|nr:uncharacterized protein LOC131244196 [Magnolia sinica]
MAVSSSAIAENTYHTRSTSMSSRSHPVTLTVEEEIIKLQTWVTLLSSISSLMDKTIWIGLGGLKCLYDSVDDLLQLPLSQQALVNHQHQKWVEAILDGWVRLLDIYSTTRDMMFHIKETVKDLQSALCRRGGDLCLENKAKTYIC